jgi:hypothetical protein
LVWTTVYGLNATEKRAFNFNDLQDNYRKAQFPVVFYLAGFYWKTMAQMTKSRVKMPKVVVIYLHFFTRKNRGLR